VSVDSLERITDDLRANKHGSKKGTWDPVCKNRYEPTRNQYVEKCLKTWTSKQRHMHKQN